MSSINITNWYEKPYYSLDAYCKNTFGEKLYKIALDAGMTCPNRDGKIDTRGCIFCSAGGSGDFAVANASLHSVKCEMANLPDNISDEDLSPFAQRISVILQEQLQRGISLFNGRITSSGKLTKKQTGTHFIAYFQSYTNTYGPIPYLRALFSAALSDDSIMGISIATRPDCISEDICLMLEELREQFSGKFIWIELGLQTIHEETARYIRRGYPLSCFEASMELLHAHNLPAIVHVILGLPGETPDMVKETIQYLNHCNIQGIKLQLLHILTGTDLYIDYQHSQFQALTMEDYLDLLMECLAILSPDIIVHRLTGDGPKNLLVAPLWSGNKRNVLNTLHRELKERNIRQGCKWKH